MTKRRIRLTRVARNKAIRAVAQCGIPLELGGEIVRYQVDKPRAMRWRIAFLRVERAGGLGV